jgi:hypothetical protein
MEIDHIPLSEVINVREMTEASSEESDKNDNKTFSNVMQISTTDDGYNSGRIYYLSTESKALLDELIVELRAKAKRAHTQALSRSWFRQMQRRLRKRYESRQFQGLMAILIAGVSSRATPASTVQLHVDRG